jgi:squalene-hopene/tetraprenyl-beta-curcumene cyclase
MRLNGLNGLSGLVWSGIVAGMLVVAGHAIAMQPKVGEVGRGTEVVKGALTAEERARAIAMMDKAVAFLKSKQDKGTGGWNVSAERPVFPAITGLVVNGMLGTPSVGIADESVGLAHKFILNYVKDDGGIYGMAGEQAMLPSYNTAICVSTLSKFTDARSKDAVKKGAEFLKRLQNSEGAAFDKTAMNDAGEKVGKDHPYYGGWGYGKSGRPDLSNSGFAIEALHAAGVESSDPAFQRALVFLQRVQMVEKIEGKPVNDMEYAKGSKQGGFIYSTSLSKDQMGSGETKSEMIEETLDDGSKVSRLRAYGSMTYAGFKSYLYAGLAKNDPRVTAARDWMKQHYTLKENPGVGTDGLYYYFVTFARANAAFGETSIEVVNPETKAKETKRWAADLVNRLAELQEPDGSFKSVDDRWMENDPVLITAYSLIALGEAVKQ